MFKKLRTAIAALRSLPAILSDPLVSQSGQKSPSTADESRPVSSLCQLPLTSVTLLEIVDLEERLERLSSADRLALAEFLSSHKGDE